MVQDIRYSTRVRVQYRNTEQYMLIQNSEYPYRLSLLTMCKYQEARQARSHARLSSLCPRHCLSSSFSPRCWLVGMAALEEVPKNKQIVKVSLLDRLIRNHRGSGPLWVWRPGRHRSMWGFGHLGHLSRRVTVSQDPVEGHGNWTLWVWALWGTSKMWPCAEEYANCMVPTEDPQAYEGDIIRDNAWGPSKPQEEWA